MNADEVRKLAVLARICISDEEAQTLSGEFDAILGYVSDVKNITQVETTASRPINFALKNIMREDANPHESGKFSEVILNNAPAREGDYIKVKKIL